MLIHKFVELLLTSFHRFIIDTFFFQLAIKISVSVFAFWTDRCLAAYIMMYWRATPIRFIQMARIFQIDI